MSNFSNQQQNVISSDKLHEYAKNRTTQRTFADKLADKSRPKPFSEENKTIYQACFFFIFLANALNIGAGFMGLRDVLTHTFFFVPFAASFIGAVLSLCILVVIEVLQWKNTTIFFGQKYFQNYVSSRRLGSAFFLTLITMSLGMYGASDTVSFVMKEPVATAVQLETVDGINKQFDPQIEDADRNAKDFKKTRSWLGKLSIEDGRKYNNLLETKNSLIAQKNAAISAMNERNKAAQAEADKKGNVVQTEHKAKVENTTAILIGFCFVALLLFWGAFYYKEFYEYMCYLELEASGQLKKATNQQQQKAPNNNVVQNQNPFATNQNQNRPIGFFSDKTKDVVQTDQQTGKDCSTTVLQAQQPKEIVVIDCEKTIDNLITYFDRAINNTGKVREENFNRVEEAKNTLSGLGFRFQDDNDGVLLIFDPRPGAVTKEKTRGGTVRAYVGPAAAEVKA